MAISDKNVHFILNGENLSKYCFKVPFIRQREYLRAAYRQELNNVMNGK